MTIAQSHDLDPYWESALNLTCPLISDVYVCTVVYVRVFWGGRSGESIRFISAAVRAMPSSKSCLKGTRAAVCDSECLLFSAVWYCFHSVPVPWFLPCYSLRLLLMKCAGWLKGIWTGQAHRHRAKEVGGFRMSVKYSWRKGSQHKEKSRVRGDREKNRLGNRYAEVEHIGS